MDEAGAQTVQWQPSSLLFKSTRTGSRCLLPAARCPGGSGHASVQELLDSGPVTEASLSPERSEGWGT